MANDPKSSDPGSGKSAAAGDAGKQNRQLQPTIDSTHQQILAAATVAPQSISDTKSQPGRSAAHTHLVVPGNFGRYKLLKVLGQGGMGAVYMAEDPMLDRKVALKIPLVDPQERSAILDRFRREAKAVAPLQFPGICPVFDVGEIDGRPYMTMAFIEGKPLSDYIDPQKPLPVKSALAMTAKIAAALDYAHKKGVIHRDLKPANIMVNERREPVVMDFGLARRSSHPQETKLTQAGSVMGTPAYMPPEQAKGDADQMGPACDIYSLGVILYEMLSGRVPFEGDIFSVMMKLATEAPPPLPSLRATVDPAVDAICQKALAKNPQDRYASMADFAKAIAAYSKNQSGASLSGSKTSIDPSRFSAEQKTPGATTPAALAPTMAFHESAESPPTKSRRWPKAIAAAAALALIAAAGVWVTIRDKDGNEIAKVKVPDGGNVTVQTTPTTTPVLTPTTTPVLTPTTTPLVTPTTAPKQTAATDSGAPLPLEAPFTSEEAKAARDAWAKHLNVPAEFTNKIGMKLTLIPPGEFMMGISQAEVDKLLGLDGGGKDPKRFANELPRHRVRITQPFYMQTTEATRGQFRQFVDATGFQTDAERQGTGGRGPVSGPRREEQKPEYVWKNDKLTPSADHPVVLLTWNDAVVCAKWLSEQDGRNYSLPTEAQWEYACRAGSENLWCGGPDANALADYAWFGNPIDFGSQPTGRKRPNAFGLFDVHGNVKELCFDNYQGEEYSGPATVDDPTGAPTGNGRAVRGSDYTSPAADSRSSRRRWFYTSNRVFDVGFRLVVNIAGSQAPAASVPLATVQKPDSPIPPATSTPSSMPTPPVAKVPFSAAEAKQHQEVWAKHLNRPVTEKNAIGMEFSLIPPGEFMMGLSQADFDALEATNPTNTGWVDTIRRELPQHRVRISKPYYMQTTEVTLGQFRKFIEATGYQTEGEEDGKGGWALHQDEGRYVQLPEYIWSYGKFTPTDDHPVVLVSWNDANEFAKWLHSLDGKNYRLPTEAQWEFACRSGTATPWFSGLRDTEMFKTAWIGDGISGTHIVGKKKPNAFGLFDTFGNVWEWCADLTVGEDYEEALSDDPTGPAEGNNRILRGGHYGAMTTDIRASRREKDLPSNRVRSTGFRLIVDLSNAQSSPSAATPAVATKTASTPAPPMLAAPFNEKTAKDSQEVWSKHLNRPVKEKNQIGMEFMLIPPGEFMMGTSQEEADALIATQPNKSEWRSSVQSEVPRRPVRLSKPFYIQTTEATFGQFRQFVDATGYVTEGEKDGTGGFGYINGGKAYGQSPEFVWKAPTYATPDNRPVVQVSWNDAIAFAAWLSSLDGKSYRLPTESQWEYCCRAGTETPWCSGAAPTSLDDYAWYKNTYRGKSQPVAQKRPNAFGLFDLHGNVWEWCSDWAGERSADPTLVVDPTGPANGSARVMRSGSFDYTSEFVRSARRYWHLPTNRSLYYGFRLIYDPAPTTAIASAVPSIVGPKTPPPAGPVPPMAVAPFSEQKAKESQEVWAKHLDRPVKEKNAIGMEFTLIPPGEYIMGASKEEADALIALSPNSSQWKAIVANELPGHKVRITKPFYMQSMEVTLGQFRQFVTAAGYKTDAEKDGKGGYAPVPGMSAYQRRPEFIWSNPQFSKSDAGPAMFVSWNDAIAFAAWLHSLDGRSYRLPTEAQWEYACRAGSDTIWPSGNKEADFYPFAWSSKDSKGSPHPVGTRKANAFGLFDLLGNASEWCADKAGGGSRYYESSPIDDPPGPSDGNLRAFRGGNYMAGPMDLRSGRRNAGSPATPSFFSGFRLTIDLPANATPASPSSADKKSPAPPASTSTPPK